jgi:hypothetical protein
MRGKPKTTVILPPLRSFPCCLYVENLSHLTYSFLIVWVFLIDYCGVHIFPKSPANWYLNKNT